jgi:hypothetical protein
VEVKLMNNATAQRTVRELDRRTNDGIEVRLLWNSLTNQVSIAVADVRNRESFELRVAGADALGAFHHPYAYATHSHAIHALAA